MADVGESSVTNARRLFADYQQIIDAALDKLLPPEGEGTSPLHKAMRYSVFVGGKRLRPILLLTAGEACGAEPDTLLPAACAVELVHTYSLIHDDLPAFDDDELRRGKPTSHIVFGEAIAILAGDALQTLAFTHLADAARHSQDPRAWSEVAWELGNAAGSTGMAGGQCQDIESEGVSLTLTDLEALHGSKTGALLTGCVRMGAILAAADEAALHSLTTYGRAVGLAFQVVDDLLDVEGSVEDLGKTPGADVARRKSTYPALLGVDAARAEAERLRHQAISALEPFGERAAPLRTIADFVVERSR